MNDCRFRMESEPRVRNTKFTRHDIGKKVSKKLEDQLLDYLHNEFGKLALKYSSHC